jgi:hypothetical protein
MPGPFFVWFLGNRPSIRFGAAIRLLNPGTLLQIVTRAKNLDVLRHQRCSSLGIRENMIEVEVVICTTFDALALISLPDLQFHF